MRESKKDSLWRSLEVQREVLLTSGAFLGRVRKESRHGKCVSINTAPAPSPDRSVYMSLPTRVTSDHCLS